MSILKIRLEERGGLYESGTTGYGLFERYRAEPEADTGDGNGKLP